MQEVREGVPSCEACMKLVSLNPTLTEILYALHDGRKVFGCTHLCPPPPSSEYKPEVVTLSKAPGPSGSVERDKLQTGLSAIPVDIDKLQTVAPSVIVTTAITDNPEDFCGFAQEYFQHHWMRNCRVKSVDIGSLNDLLDAYGNLGTLIGMGPTGRDRAQRIKSQLLDWGRNLYERLRNKKTVVLSSVEPLAVAGCWVPDMIRLVSGRPMFLDLREMSRQVTWEELAAFAPDSIMVAPRGKTLEESVRYLRKLEEAPVWDTLPAVKRGEVVFADGIRIYQAGAGLLEGAGILVSVMAGLDAGYITKREEFHRLRYVELHRHRFL
jgi:ABC-type Fe3+-hydroxamate transport system substrate-binding protein